MNFWRFTASTDCLYLHLWMEAVDYEPVQQFVDEGSVIDGGLELGEPSQFKEIEKNLDIERAGKKRKNSSKEDSLEEYRNRKAQRDSAVAEATIAMQKSAKSKMDQERRASLLSELKSIRLELKELLAASEPDEADIAFYTKRKEKIQREIEDDASH